ncbi:hypothetical protein ABEB36_009772 [Hypothenemus hampei]|uniref:Uncharacterized protein n=1 Tax=Hypothenemus hampei TaxID=57062 RepID=A0ABD1EJJ9_HYPHA
MDADNAEQVRNNEETILRNEELVKILHEKRADLMKLKSDKIKSLETEEQLLQEQYGKNRRQLRKHVILDEKQLGILTTNSNQVLDDLEKIFERGCQIIVLSQACRKFETERETIAKWLPIFKYSTIDDGWTDDEKLHLLEAKSDDSNDKSFVKKCYLNLEKLENFWAIYNKAEVDVMELKQEKVALIEENQHLKTLIRNFLEAAALCRRTSISTTRSAPHIGRSALKNH